MRTTPEIPCQNFLGSIRVSSEPRAPKARHVQAMSLNKLLSEEMLSLVEQVKDKLKSYQVGLTKNKHR